MSNAVSLDANSIVSTTLAIQTGSTPTTALSIDGSQNITLAGATATTDSLQIGGPLLDGASYVGAAGQVLTSGGSGIAPTWEFPVALTTGSPGYFGQFYDTQATQPAASSTTAYPVQINTTDVSNGVTIVNDASSNPTLITFANAGDYNLQYSIQFVNTDSTSIHNTNVWFRKNGQTSAADIPDSNSQWTVPNKHGGINGQMIAAVNYIVHGVQPGDYYQLVFQSEDPTTFIESIAAGTTPPTPVSPGVIFTAIQISQVGIGYFGLSSNTSVTIAVTPISVTTNLTADQIAFAVGTRVRLANPTLPANFMEGVITSFTGTTLDVDVDLTGGSGTFADWNVSVAGEQGVAGSGGLTAISVASANGFAGTSSGGTTPQLTLTTTATGLLQGNGTAISAVTIGTGLSFSAGTLANTGVTSVALSLPSIFNVSGSPVTTTGTLTATLANETANTVFAGPASGAAAAPTFRTLGPADITTATAYVAKSSAYTATTADYTIGVTGTTTITLPDATTMAGKIFVIKNLDAANTTTVATTSSQTIDGTTTRTMPTQYQSITVQSTGAQWIIISEISITWAGI